MAFILSGFADEYSADFNEQLEGFQLLGIKNIELRFIDGENVSVITDEKVDEIKEKLKSAKIGVSAIGSPIGKISIEDDFDTHLKVAEKVFKLARELNCKYIRVFSFYLNGKERKLCFKQVCKRLGELLALAEKFGVILCHENEEGLYGQSPEQCFELLQYFGGKLRCVFDMGNFLLGGYSPENAYELLKNYVEYFHVKDALKDGTIVPCGEGDAQIENIFCKYNEENPQKNVYVSLEPHLVDFVGLNALATHDLKKKVTFNDEKEAFTYAHKNLIKIIEKVNK
ncbi:MAG: sugar phosphate isomerase/epimerase [Clostridia bacterium]|nr:sugar phosphate isomerase/epimerase [Clostridia bacterium]